MSDTYKWDMQQQLPVTSITALKYEPELMDAIEAIFLEHGGTIEQIDDSYFRAHFPTGTIKTELYPRLHSVRYEITFPDNFAIYEVITRDGMEGLQFPLSAFPEEFQEKYQR